MREGQRSAMFDKFPYEQVEKQSFSLVYQQEGSSSIAAKLHTLYSTNFTPYLKTDKRYAYLTSLDLICDQPESYDLWIKEVDKANITIQLLSAKYCTGKVYTCFV